MNSTLLTRPKAIAAAFSVMLAFATPAFSEPVTFRYESRTLDAGGAPTNVTVVFTFDSNLANGTGSFGTSPTNGSYGPWTGTLTLGLETVQLSGGTIEVLNDAGSRSSDGYDFRWDAHRGESVGTLTGGQQLCFFRVLLAEETTGAMLSSIALPTDTTFAAGAQFIQDDYQTTPSTCDDYGAIVQFGQSEYGPSPDNRDFSLRVDPPTPSILWYNGDGDPTWFNGGLHSNIDWLPFDKSEMVYEDFVVDSPEGWTVTDLWSNNVTNSRVPIVAARWSIRQAMVAGEVTSGGGGQVIAEGLAPATQILHQQVDDPFGLVQEFTIRVSGLDVRLPPGTYWVAVAPVIEENDQSLPSDTLGYASNAVGVAGGSDNAYVHQQDWAYAGQDEFVLSSRASSRDGPPNYSLGVGGFLGGGLTDTSRPLITAQIAGTVGAAEWYVTDAQVAWTVTDDESAISESTGCDSSSVTTDTAGTVFTCSATSAGGTSTESVTIKRDATAPTATASAGPPANSFGWHKRNVTVSFTGTDAMSGGVTCDPNVVLSSEGTYQSASGRCYDAAGNMSALASAGGINIDKTAPTITVISPTNYSCSDALSGVLSCVGTVKKGKLIVNAEDRAGNKVRK